MSCALSSFAYIENVDRVVSCLYQLDVNSKDSLNEEWKISDDYDWGWEDVIDGVEVEENEVNSQSKDNFHTRWLQDCQIAISPCEDLVALGREDRLVILSAKWDRQATSEPKTKFEISWSGLLDLEEGECISSIICIPLASQHKSSQGFPDWTCIVAGFTSGYIRFYLQDGSLLLHQILHEDPVLKVKCQTWQPDVSFINFEQVEELVILYPTSLVIIDGFSLYQSLRGCRNQLARVQASGRGESIRPPPLAYKKWNLKGQKNITDIASCGVVMPSLFDHLQNASLIGGCDAKIRASPPSISQFVTSGADPFVGLYSALDEGSIPLMSEVAFEVATKLTSAVLSKLSVASGWFGWTESKVDDKQTYEKAKNKPKVEKGSSLSLRFGLADHRREGTSITLSPDGRLAASTDEFGRIMLMSMKDRIVLRSWKGYRDAECAWVPVQEEHHDHNSEPMHPRRTALFLVIYAPRRGILEVWTSEHGPRAAAFNVGRNNKFINISHHILGLSHVMSQSSDVNSKPLRCVLFQPSGSIKILTIPFHCALSNKHGRRVRDLHLLTKLSTVLDEVKSHEIVQGRTFEKFETTVLEIFSSIQVPALLQQALQCLLSTPSMPVSLLEKAVMSVAQNVSKKPNVSDDHEHEDANDIEALVEYTKVQRRIIDMYKTLHDEKKRIENVDGVIDDESECDEVLKGTEWLVSTFSITSSEALSFLNSIECYWDICCGNHKKTQQSPSSNDMTITTFLSCFEVTKIIPKNDKNDAKTNVTEGHCLRIRKNLSSKTQADLGEFLFGAVFKRFLSIEKLCLIIDSSSIYSWDIMRLLLNYWLISTEEKILLNLSAVSCLRHLMSSINSMKGEQNDCDMTSWEQLRHSLAETSVTSQTLSAAVCCRSVLLEKQVTAKKLEDDQNDPIEHADWVSVSLDMERWNLLVNQLEDVLNLVVFCFNLETDFESSVSSSELNNLNVLDILGRGQFWIPEIIAKHVVRLNVLPEKLGFRTLKRSPPVNTANNDDRPLETDEDTSIFEMLPGLSELRKRFPHSLSRDVLWAHCMQECLSQWLTNKEQPDFLKKGLAHVKCIENRSLRHGLCVRLWYQVNKSISSLAALTEKVGKAPKERLCVKTLNMSCDAVIEFLNNCRLILHFLAEMLSEDCDQDNKELIFEIEDFWRTGEVCPPSFIQESMATNLCNSDLIGLHYWFVSVLWFIMEMGMKSVKPLTLLSGKEKKCVFKQLNLPFEFQDVEPEVLHEREMFFHKSVSALVQVVAAEESSPMRTQSFKDLSRDWSTSIFQLAEQVEIKIEPLKEKYTCELCLAGLYKLAGMEFQGIRDKTKLSAKILEIVGERMAEHLFENKDPSDTARILSRIPFSVSSWLRKQAPLKEFKRGTSLNGVKELLCMVQKSLSDERPRDYELVTSLIEILKYLQ